MRLEFFGTDMDVCVDGVSRLCISGNGNGSTVSSEMGYRRGTQRYHSHYGDLAVLKNCKGIYLLISQESLLVFYRAKQTCKCSLLLTEPVELLGPASFYYVSLKLKFRTRRVLKGNINS
jgi:hypothetical protein